MGANETWRAIEAAKDAFVDWSRKPAKERSILMRRWHDLIMANVEDLGALMTAEQGKPLTEAKGEVAYAASFIEWFAEEAKRVYGDTIPSPWNDRRLVVIKQPIGVCAAVTPWNFPAAMIARKAGPALAAGCTDGGETRRVDSAIGFCARGFGGTRRDSPGVFNVMTGEAREIGGEMTSNPDVRKITFTGSTEVGRLLMKQSSSTIKKLSLELGGNAPFIVFDDADLDAAVEGAIISKYRNAGQTCVCANRLYVQAGVYDAFAEKLVAAVGKLKVGNGFEPDVQQGPLIDYAAVEKDRGTHPGRRLEGRPRRARRQAPCAWPDLFRADGADWTLRRK